MSEAAIASVVLRFIGGPKQVPRLREQIERELAQWTEFVQLREAQLAAIDYLLRPTCTVTVKPDVLEWLTGAAARLDGSSEQ